MLELIFSILYVLLTLVSIYVIVKLTYAYRHFRVPTLRASKLAADDLPSVSVCIPARNETHAMTQCLESVIRSNYPKLEIIVLDDSSVDDTSYLIKSFAHAGVRFVEGSPLPDDWLGKNHALEGLLGEASGSYILYLDVDTRVEPDTISQLVGYALDKQAKMVSILPMRKDGYRASVLFATLRYLWELLLHRPARPATASAAWLVHRHTLRDQLGGFAPHKLEVQPESHLSRELTRENAYRFVMSSLDLGVSYEKKWRSQLETSVRLLYPRLGGSWWSSIFVLLLFVVLISPIVFLLLSIVTGWTILQTMMLWQLCVFIALYATYLSRIWRRGWWLGALLWPAITLQEAVLYVGSQISYARGSVNWKGRAVRTRVRASHQSTSL